MQERWSKLGTTRCRAGRRSLDVRQEHRMAHKFRRRLNASQCAAQSQSCSWFESRNLLLLLAVPRPDLPQGGVGVGRSRSTPQADCAGRGEQRERETNVPALKSQQGEGTGRDVCDALCRPVESAAYRPALLGWRVSVLKLWQIFESKS